MLNKFEELDDVKKQKIIDAAITEFAEKGYERASTNAIVKGAEISKGLLFHYFESKKNLFVYVLDYAIKKMVAKSQRHFSQQTSALPGKHSGDLFEMLLQRGQMKLRLAVEEPLLYRLIFSAFVSWPDDVEDELQKRNAGLFADQRHAILMSIDKSNFRDDIDPAKAVDLVMIFIEGLYSKYIEVYRHMTPEQVLEHAQTVQAETEEYFDLLKRGIYKPVESSED